MIRRYCILCGDRSEGLFDLCRACHGDLPVVPSACPHCALPLPSELSCGRCLQNPPPYEACIAPFHYRFPIDELLKAAKFRQNLHYASHLGRILAVELRCRGYERPDCLIPVPLHRWRLFRRGYNQALELARDISQQLEIPIDWKICRRIRNTPPQAGLSAQERRRNLRAAFRVDGAIPYRHVAIVDDVITTGQTVAELAQALHKAGVERVDVWAFARATPDLTYPNLPQTARSVR